MKRALLSLATTAVFASSALAQSQAEQDRYDALVAHYQSATIVGEPSLSPCTLSENAAGYCLNITVVAAPADHITGPYCPLNISDTAEAGGKWFVDGKVMDVDGEFIANLSEIYQDDIWQMFDPETGDVFLRNNEIGCIVAGDPTNATGQPNNICVDCSLGFIGETVTNTYQIPLSPVPRETSESDIRQGVGLAFNGVKVEGPAPLELILGGHTLGPFDDCGGHINPSEGYHYHGIMDGCGARVAAAIDGHAAQLGVALDGFDLYEQLDQDGTEPADLDACRGHSVAGLGYHYHVSDTATNQILPCLTGQTACTQLNEDGGCDPSPRGGRPSGPPPGADQ
ncbi:hypothetical protein DS901_10690 [Loktanella sp. D2R18]|uniref:YHYH protein n=1 Tax=Rhodobacterales TaxID=204455 RepID=UPI000DE8BF46|nr:MULTISPECIES: YHYH protein [Rhodobacterales]MDO6590859.1 YHYH protein [Yoonia sp. 1_MG-2023]RBW43283.1 hypothetical protein DS901_10690 [Loktanella sp. D2R18]